MFRKSCLVRDFLKSVHIPNKTGSLNLTFGRAIHTPNRLSLNNGLIFSNQYAWRTSFDKRVIGFSSVVCVRTETTASQIPPVTSEVFSKKVEVPDALNENVTSSGIDGISTDTKTLSSLSSSDSPNIDSKVTTTSGSDQSQLVWESIPEPPSIPVETVTSIVGEPSLASLGLGGWSPSGIVQQCLEMCHVSLGLPWWGSIMLGTVCVRLLLFPLVIKSQRNAANMANNMPQMQTLQMKMTEARQTGDALMAAKYGHDLMEFMKEKNISPFKSLLVPLAMAPVFVSFFFGLRKMANLPVESMKEGGLWWFYDLTVADPYYLLPLLTSLTFWITVEIGVDGVQLNNSNHGQIMRYVFRALPIIMFPFTMHFPAAILCYWVSTNAVSLLQTSLLKLPAVRGKLNIPIVKKFTPEELPIKKKGVVHSFKESWTNLKITKEMEDRQRYNEASFKRAGSGPIPKTYKYDPTKISNQPPIQAKAKKS